MKVFIDCGGHNSCSARIFNKLYNQKGKFHIYTFEIEPSFFKYYKNIPNHTLIKKAVWTDDGDMYFYRDSEARKAGGGLIKKENPKRHNTEPIIVETIDLSRWISENFSREDIIDVKMDIEGAEYHVIPDMVDRGTFNIIRKFYIEWHWYKVGINEDHHKRVEAMIPCTKRNWPGIEQAEKILGKNYLSL